MKMDPDREKIESLEAELVRMHDEAKKYEGTLTAEDMAMVTTKSWWQKLGETLASTEH